MVLYPPCDKHQAEASDNLRSQPDDAKNQTEIKVSHKISSIQIGV